MKRAPRDVSDERVTPHKPGRAARAVKAHAKPVPIVTAWSKIPARWERCPRCGQVRTVGFDWRRPCIVDKKASRYLGE